MLREANLEAQKIIEETRIKSKELFDHQQEQLEKDQSAQKVWQEAQKKLKNWQEQLADDIPQPIYEGQAPANVKVGDYVYLPKYNQYGNVIAEANSVDEVMVQIGVVKLKAKRSEIRPAQEKKEKRHKSAGRSSNTDGPMYK